MGKDEKVINQLTDGPMKGRWIEIEKFVGEGTFGKVYRAKFVINDKQPKIDEFSSSSRSPERGSSSRSPERGSPGKSPRGEVPKYAAMKMIEGNKKTIDVIINELRVLRMLPENVFYGYFEISTNNSNYHCFVTKWYNSGDLYNFINRNVPKKSTILSFIRDILKRILSLEKLGICHRDIKPDNIMVNEELIITTTEKLNKHGEKEVIEEKKTHFSLHFIDYGLSCKECDGYPLQGTVVYMHPQILKKNASREKLTQEDYMMNDVYCGGLTIYFIYFETIPCYYGQEIETWEDMKSLIECKERYITFNDDLIDDDVVKDILNQMINNNLTSVEELYEKHKYYLKHGRNKKIN